MIYLPPEIWIKIIRIADAMKVYEKKMKFELIHRDIWAWKTGSGKLSIT